jgi:hypothetical protein
MHLRSVRKAFFSGGLRPVGDHLTLVIAELRGMTVSWTAFLPYFPLTERIPVTALRAFPRSGTTIRGGRAEHLHHQMAMQTLRRLAVDKTATWLNGLDHTLSPLITVGRCNVRGGVEGTLFYVAGLILR